MPLLVGTTPLSLEEFPPDLPTRFYLGESGIVLGQGEVVDDAGCVWMLSGKNLWGAKPAPREETGDRTYNHGQWDATNYYGPRVIPITGTCRAPDHATLHTAEQRLRNAVGVRAFTLRGTEPGFDSWATVRQSGEIDWVEDGWTPPHASFSFGLYARDPLLYSSLERPFGPIAYPSISGGLSWPTTWPAEWDSDVISGSVQLFNPGTEPVGLQLRVTGPLTDGSIVFPELGQALYIDNPDGPALAAGQLLSIDTDTQTVMLGGDASRRSWVYGDFLQLPPNLTTTLSISGTGTTVDSTVSGLYRAVRI